MLKHSNSSGSEIEQPSLKKQKTVLLEQAPSNALENSKKSSSTSSLLSPKTSLTISSTSPFIIDYNELKFGIKYVSFQLTFQDDVTLGQGAFGYNGYIIPR